MRGSRSWGQLSSWGILSFRVGCRTHDPGGLPGQDGAGRVSPLTHRVCATPRSIVPQQIPSAKLSGCGSKIVPRLVARDIPLASESIGRFCEVAPDRPVSWTFWQGLATKCRVMNRKLSVPHESGSPRARNSCCSSFVFPAGYAPRPPNPNPAADPLHSTLSPTKHTLNTLVLTIPPSTHQLFSF